MKNSTKKQQENTLNVLLKKLQRKDLLRLPSNKQTTSSFTMKSVVLIATKLIRRILASTTN
jgi:hypothetical protein